MQTSKNLKRLISTVLAVALMLTAIPFATSADEATAKDTIVFGGLSWDIVTKEDDGDLVIVTTDVLAKAAFNTKAPMDFATSSLYKTLNTTFYASFSDAEKAAITPTTITYDYWDATAGAKVTGATLSANVVVPDATMAESLGAANLNGSATQYFLASARANTKTDAVVAVVTKTGSISNASGTSKTASGYRAVITLKAGNFAQFPAVDGVSYTVNDNAVTYYATTSATDFKVIVDTDNYSADELAVALGDSALTAADGVYTIPAGSAAEVTVSGIKAQPADFTAYNDAVAKAGEVDKDLCDTTDLDAALAVDVSACTKLEQAKVDEATAAILDAIANLKYKPADLTEYNKALETARKAFNDKNGEYYSIKETEPESQTSYELLLWDLLDKYEDDTDTPISSLTIDKQDEVDAATKVLNDFVASIPLKRADTSKWSAALRDIRNIKPNLYSNAAELIAEAEALVAENNYAALNPDITYQAEIDASTEALKAIFAKRKAILVDYSALDATLERAATYLEENYYKDEDLAELYEEDELKQIGSGTKAWEEFVAQRDAVLAIDRTLYATAADQATVDSYTEALIRVMEALDKYERYTKMEEDFINPTKAFFTKISDFFGLVNGLFTTLAGLLPLVIIGELVLYDVFVMIGDEDLLAFVEKIGIKPPAEESAPEEPAA